jgi:hypothetical protein
MFATSISFKDVSGTLSLCRIFRRLVGSTGKSKSVELAPRARHQKKRRPLEFPLLWKRHPLPREFVFVRAKAM